MPIRWRGVFLGFGFFFAGMYTGNAIYEVSEGMDRFATKAIAKHREEIARLEAQGDSKSWDKAQNLKIEINELEARTLQRTHKRERQLESAEQSADRFYRNSTRASFDSSSSSQTVDPKVKEGNKIIEGAILRAINDLDANGDDESREMALHLKDRLQTFKKNWTSRGIS